MDPEENSSSEHDVDAILASAYGDNQNPGIDAPERPTAPVEKSPEPPQFKEYEFNARGQAVKIKENDPRFQQWLSQGYDYAQNIIPTGGLMLIKATSRSFLIKMRFPSRLNHISTRSCNLSSMIFR